MFAMFVLSPMELLILLGGLVLILWPLWRICSRAGFSGALALLVIIPFGVIVLLFVLAFAEWPALRRRPGQQEELAEQGAAADRPHEYDASSQHIKPA